MTPTIAEVREALDHGWLVERLSVRARLDPDGMVIVTRELLASAMQAFQDHTYLDENNHRYHCGGSEADLLWAYLVAEAVR